MFKRILILDFKNLSPDDADDYLSISVPIEITHLLSQHKRIKIVSFHSKPLLEKEFSEKIKVDFFLEGSFLNKNNHIRFNFQLINAHDATCALSIKLDEHTKNIFQLIDSVASQVVQFLELEFISEKKQPNISPEAYKYYLKGVQYWDLWNEDTVKLAISYFKKVIVIAPNFVMAYVRLSQCYSLLAAILSANSLENYSEAKTAAIKAIALDEKSIEAHLSLALIKLVNDLDILGAYYSLENAFAIDNSYAKAHHYYAYYLISIGKYNKALESLDFVLKSDPTNLQVNSTYGFTLLLLKKYEMAEAHLKRTLNLYPNSEVTYDALIWTYIFTKQYHKAEKLVENSEVDLVLSPAIQIIIYKGLDDKVALEFWQNKLNALLKNDSKGSYSKEASAVYFAFGDTKRGAKHFDIFYRNKMGFIRALSHPAWLTFRESDKFYIYKKRLKLLKPPVLPNKLTESNEDIIVIHSSTSEIMAIDSKLLLYIESQGVYCNVVFLNDNTIMEEKILRTSLTKILNDTFYLHFYRCHRSFIVNTKIPYLFSGNKKSAKLSLDAYDIEIPISRNEILEVSRLFDAR